MNKIKAIEGTLIFIIMILIAYAFNVTIDIQKNISNNEKNQSANKPEYHFAIISDDITSYSWSSLIDGIKTKAKEKNVVIEVYEIIDIHNENEVAKTFEMVMLSKVDGVMVELSDNDIARKEIIGAQENGVKVITIGNDSPESKRDAYVGTNKFNMGSMTASLLIENGQEEQDVLLILGREFTELSGASSNNYLNGLHEKVKSTTVIDMLYVEHTSEKRAELIVNDSLKYRNIDAIICTDPVDSLRAIKVLVDLNLVGEIQFVASSDLPEVLEYIEKGTIGSSVVEDFEIMGSTSVEVLYQLLDENRQSGYISIPIKIIDKSNILVTE